MSLRFLISEANRQQIGEDALRLLSEVYSEYLNGIEATVEIELATPEDIRSLNKTYRQLDEPTDVLSFPILASHEEIEDQKGRGEILLGSITICPQKATTYGETLPQLVHHGLLHLLGYDHETDFATWYTEEAIVLQTLTERGLVIPAVVQ